jgi:hypothetical protein
MIFKVKNLYLNVNHAASYFNIYAIIYSSFLGIFWLCHYALQLSFITLKQLPDKTLQVKLEIYLSELKSGMYLFTCETSGFN